MKARLLKLWESRSPRDRAVIAILVVLVAGLLYVLLLQSAYRARTHIGSSLTVLRAQAQRLNADAAELDRVRAAPIPAVPQTDLRSQIQAAAASAGLARALLRIDAPDPNQVQVVFGSVAFADWLAWIAGLQAQHVRLESSRIEALSTPGLVGVTATLSRARPQ